MLGKETYERLDPVAMLVNEPALVPHATEGEAPRPKGVW